MKALDSFYTPLRSEPPHVTVVFGASGAGKTRWAMLGPSPYLLPCGGRNQTDFFGDYRPRQHQTLVADDFYGGWKYTTFLRVCDRYPTEVQTKGGYLQLLTNQIVFTSNVHPFSWYPKVLAHVDRRRSFDRRIHCIVEVFEDFYIVRRGNLPWPFPFLRAATAFEAARHPWRPEPPQPLQVTGMEPHVPPPPRTPQSPPSPLPAPPNLVIRLPLSPPPSPQSPPAAVMPAAPHLTGPMRPAQWAALLNRPGQDVLQQEVERVRSSQSSHQGGPSSESFWLRRNAWNQSHRARGLDAHDDDSRN